jgi:biotin transport system substrate-specific component
MSPTIVNAVQVNGVQERQDEGLMARNGRGTGGGGAGDLARVAVFAALIVVLGVSGAVPMPSGVPITLQTLGVMLAGIVLGPRRGAAAVLVVLALAAVGLPVLSNGRGGLGVFVGASAGYLIGWVPGVVVTGLIARRVGARLLWWRAALGAVVGGVLTVYAVGVPVMAAVTGMGLLAAATANLVFLPGDLIKVVVATALAMALQKAYPRALALAPRRADAGTGATGTGAA